MNHFHVIAVENNFFVFFFQIQICGFMNCDSHAVYELTAEFLQNIENNVDRRNWIECQM